MARIRTIKPSFFRHEGLQDLEISNPGKYPMMVFAGLWGHCDKAGRFEWKPRTLKLDILPFLPFDMEETLLILVDAGMVIRYSVNGKEYGMIESFPEHQRIGGKESQEPEKFPAPTGEKNEKKQGSNREATVKQLGLQEGKGMEGNKEGNGVNPAPKKSAPFDPVPTLREHGVSDSVATDWITLRKAKKAAVTETALKGIIRESNKAGVSLQAALEICCQRGWQGFEASWIEKDKANGTRAGPSGYAQQKYEDGKRAVEILTGKDKTNGQPAVTERDITGEAVRIA